MADPRSAQRTTHPMPFTRLEIVVMQIIEGRLQALLVRRAEAPEKGKWALPGGVLRIDLDRSLDDAAGRVAFERLQITPSFLRQLYAVGGPSRDPRAPWALSIVYRAVVQGASLDATSGKRIQAIAWKPVEDVMHDRALAFDHAALIERAVITTRAEIDALDLPAGFMPDAFTLGELQFTCEQWLDRRLDKSSFRRRVADRALVEPIAGLMTSGAFRPAQLYRFAAR